MSLHVSSKLIGYKVHDTSKLRADINAMKPYLLGFIDTLEENASLKKQKALTKNSEE
jgi:hypothetical protein